MKIIITTKKLNKQLRHLKYERYKKSKISNKTGFVSQFRFTIFLILVLLFVYTNFICHITHKKNVLKVVSFYQLLTINNPFNKRIIIFEPNPYHYECTPGFSKYFVELGYNVDIIMHSEGIDSFVLFKKISKITLFIYNNINEIKKNLYKLYNDLGLFSINK